MLKVILAKVYSYKRRSKIQSFSPAFSMLEALLAIIVIAVIGVGVTKSTIALKLQNAAISLHTTEQGRLAQTHMLLSNYLVDALPTSLKQDLNRLEWEGYEDLYLKPQANKPFLDSKPILVPHLLEFKKGSLFLDDALLLSNVAKFETHLESTPLSNDTKALYIEVCNKFCLSDRVVLHGVYIEL
ncbi:hypothetical protein BKH43_04215 [Helicobacter sp. 13S00401-1]|uniref:hypothetical protein n=1 Tax=Helicobacter sp. 13S00401-1 TaxID=1905758 RepID=UPI000BA6DACB|nr:hypothetical protein [Helicobacter sp. 13S00401-1]PAF50768.1 hypothetical protein BKH43_04215 [Helicobacter sp. 13S00401-1]